MYTFCTRVQTTEHITHDNINQQTIGLPSLLITVSIRIENCRFSVHEWWDGRQKCHNNNNNIKTSDSRRNTIPKELQEKCGSWPEFQIRVQTTLAAIKGMSIFDSRCSKSHLLGPPSTPGVGVIRVCWLHQLMTSITWVECLAVKTQHRQHRCRWRRLRCQADLSWSVPRAALWIPAAAAPASEPESAAPSSEDSPPYTTQLIIAPFLSSTIKCSLMVTSIDWVKFFFLWTDTKCQFTPETNWEQCLQNDHFGDISGLF